MCHYERLGRSKRRPEKRQEIRIGADEEEEEPRLLVTLYGYAQL